MKKIILFVILVIAWVGAASLTSDASKGQPTSNIEFKQKSYDFGTIKEADGKVSTEFKFTNTGDAPLVIISANAGCGCTHPEYDEKPIAPGASSSIKVTYNPKGRPGEFTKNVTVRTNSAKTKKVTLKISGLVIPKD